MENYFDKIQDYLDGLLSKGEDEDFKKELDLNAGLRKETENQKHLNEVIANRIKAEKGLNNLKHSLESNRATYFGSTKEKDSLSSKSKIISIKKWYISMAVAASILIGLNFMGIFSTDLAQLPSIQSEKTRGNNDQSILTEAIDKYNIQEYDESAILFSSLLEKDSTNVRFQYYLGLSYLGDKQPQVALELLLPIANGSSIYAEDATYFTAIAAWKQNQIDIATKYAKKIPSESAYYKNAKKLLKKVEK